MLCPIGLLPLSSCSVFCLLLYSLNFEVCFVRHKYCYPNSLFISICASIFFNPFSFSLHVSFILRWVFCRQSMYGSCFHIHSAIACLWLEYLSHLHLKWLMIAVYFYFILLIMFLFCFVFFLFLKEEPVTLFVVLLLWSNYISLFLSMKLLMSLSIKKIYRGQDGSVGRHGSPLHITTSKLQLKYKTTITQNHHEYGWMKVGQLQN